MIKKLSLLSLTFLLLFSCSFTEYPEFVGVENVKIIDKNFKTFTLSADAHFKNPNDVGGTLKTDQLNVFINDMEVATIVTKTFDVPSKKEFTIPLTVKISTNKIIDKKNIAGILSSFTSKKINLQYKGIIDYKVAGFSSSYDVDYSEEIVVKL
ncbi:MAG: hypothetical protein ACPGUH_04810 [Winogradskyella sp.]